MSHPDRQQNVADRLDHLRQNYTNWVPIPDGEEEPDFLTKERFQRHAKQIMREETRETYDDV